MSRRSIHPANSPLTRTLVEVLLEREPGRPSAQEEDNTLDPDRPRPLNEHELQTQSRSGLRDGRQSRASGVHAILNPAETPSVDALSESGRTRQQSSQQFQQDTQAGAALISLHTSAAPYGERYGISSSPRRASHPGTLDTTSPPQIQTSSFRMSTHLPGQPRSYSLGGGFETSHSSHSTSPLTSVRPQDSQNPSPIEYPPGGRASFIGEQQPTSHPAQPGSADPSDLPPGHEYMTIQTEKGPVSVLVDVTAASKAADEKRKRNAGASARFRARRKERENASTKENDGLRQQITNLTEEVKFYKQERDYFASVVYHGPDRDRHFPRPLSPRQRRGPQPASAPIPPPPVYEERGTRGQEGAYTRRRLTLNQPIEAGPPAAPPPQLPPPSYPSAYTLPPGSTPSLPRAQHSGGYSASGTRYPETK